MNGIPVKKINSRPQNWISLIKFVEKRQKSEVRLPYCNLYAYAANNPVHYIDPDGRDNNDVVEYQTPTNANDYHCDIFAWNLAIDNNFDPRGQDSATPDLNWLTVAGWFTHFPNNRNNVPPENSSGYAFYDNTDDGIDNPTHMEFYDNQDTNSNTYIRYVTNGITTPVPQEKDIPTSNSNWTFVPLPSLDNEEENGDGNGN